VKLEVTELDIFLPISPSPRGNRSFQKNQRTEKTDHLRICQDVSIASDSNNPSRRNQYPFKFAPADVGNAYTRIKENGSVGICLLITTYDALRSRGSTAELEGRRNPYKSPRAPANPLKRPVSSLAYISDFF
jgi:hypothetical protein